MIIQGNGRENCVFKCAFFSVKLYKEYTSLKSRELEELLRFQVMSWQPS